MQQYQIKVGNTLYPGTHDKLEAEKIISGLKNCVLDPIELIPINQEVSV